MGGIEKKGGFRACTFLFALGALENMGYVANMVSFVIYFTHVLHFNNSNGANSVTNFMGSSFLLSILGAFIADTYLNKLYTCLIFGAIEVMGLTMVTIQAWSKDLQPEDCGKPSCVNTGQGLMFFGSLCVLALGTGGVKGALPALGGDQFDWNEKKEGAIASFYNWFLLCSTTGSMVGVTVIVWVSMNKGWYLGFMIGTICTLLGYIVLGCGKPFYRFQPRGDSPLLKISQVIVVAFQNRNLQLPENPGELFEIDDSLRGTAEERIQHSNQLRSLDKAAILRQEAGPDPWKVCTVTQVEEVKILTRMLPIILSTVIMNTCMAQLQTFSVIQGMFMDPYIGSYKFPVASIPVIPLAFMFCLIPIYEFLFVPFARWITGLPNGIIQLQRVGVGLVLSIISMSVAAVIEVHRRDKAIRDPTNPVTMFWLSFQFGIFGIADMFTVVGLLEFFYQEAPPGMRSLSTSFTWLTMSFGYFLSTIFVNLINAVTKRITPSGHGWLEGNNLNTVNLDLFYWFLAVLSSINFVIYLVSASIIDLLPNSSMKGVKLVSLLHVCLCPIWVLAGSLWCLFGSFSILSLCVWEEAGRSFTAS